ncbi:sulfurtransferase [Rhodovibrio sodomensis]|nr:rhodanese-like domain-containing protein [Rhodovibrio sodomensis]
MRYMSALTAAFLLASAAVTDPALAGGPVTPGAVVDADWLAEHRGEVAVLDVRRDLESFAGGHIPKAAPVGWDAVRTTRTIDGVERQKVRLAAETFQRLMREAGVDANEPVVITSPGKAAGQITTQARLYWQFAYYGHDDVAILDGGNAAWRAAGHDLATGPAEVSAGDYTAGAPDDSVLATVAEVDAARTNAGVQLTDNRPMAYYLGLEQAGYVYAAGHIPSAVNVPFTLNVAEKGPATLRDAESLRAVYAYQGAPMDLAAIAYCNSGHVSALTWFVMSEVLGNDDAQLFDGSMHVWTQDESRPVTNPARR